ncbi:MAG: tRNA-dihydrouridine synthase family protein [bacterium]
MFSETVIRGVSFKPGLFCAPLAEVTHSAFRRLVTDFGGCGALCTEMLAGRQILKDDLHSPYLRRNPGEKRLIYQLMLRRDDPIDRIIGRLSEIGPDGIDLNLACYAPVVRKVDACSRLFENIPALTEVLQAARRCWAGPLTVKIRLGHDVFDAREQFAERLRVIEESGVDAVTLHPRFFEDKLKRRARHELFAWVASITRLPLIANGDILGARTLRENPALFEKMSGVMIGRMAIARPWIFAAWEQPMQVDYAGVWRRLHAYIREDFPPVTALKRIKLFTKYYARNFLFGHNFDCAVQNAPSLDAALERANAFFSVSMDLHDEPSLMGL